MARLSLIKIINEIVRCCEDFGFYGLYSVLFNPRTQRIFLNKAVFDIEY